ncbi:hypothetical protein OV090_31500 [Nannocystis sp. RBIL2]|uniref:hypothetical protein n=1 Tax=Nannocystis sp. RBIL2 TaxID=2996788 RepID=UPI00226EC21F|nr:hypothetical protein [Nannocystis sp. RBIL2]MCY1069309.1 hypothetical protein [Nannocystis sp. RBIL2]
MGGAQDCGGGEGDRRVVGPVLQGSFGRRAGLGQAAVASESDGAQQRAAGAEARVVGVEVAGVERRLQAPGRRWSRARHELLRAGILAGAGAAGERMAQGTGRMAAKPWART